MRLKIKEWMELRNLSQAQIAAGLGVSRATVSAWVEGRPGKDGKRIVVFPDDDAFEALCLFMECTPSDMLELQRRKTPTGLVWRDFRDTKRGPGRPPSVATARARATAANEVEPARLSARAVIVAPPHEEGDLEEAVTPRQEEDDIEEILLFPEHQAPAAEEPTREPPRSSDELLGTFGNAPLALLREWLGIQLSQAGGQLRRTPTPENKALVAAHMKALDRLDEFTDLALLRDWLGDQLSRTNSQLRQAPSPEIKAMQTAYTKALNKLDHYARLESAGS